MNGLKSMKQAMKHVTSIRTAFINFLNPSALADINRKLNIIMATQAEHLTALQSIRSALTEASTEIVNKIAELTAAQANSGNTTPEEDAITADLVNMAQALANIVPGSPAAPADGGAPTP